ncbi:MAG: carboxypeptidase-like regulatory domain-containing protein [Fibromonadaceae bacterium]|jgi:hypothetical protein|nr:carboxypeptidase-like regulatory domain-containing protein [Fibromonadaceae bacterium]
MKKIIPIFAIGMLALVACGKKGTVSGTVIDPFNGKAVELPTVWVSGTVHNSQKIPGGLPDGKFKFEGLEPGTYTMAAGKSKYSKGSAEFTITNENLEVSQNVYIYSQTVTPGLYRPIEGSEAEKIINDWAIWQPTCKESGFVLRTKFVSDVENPKTKKKEKKDMMLPPPRDVPVNITVLYKIATSVSSPIDVVSYPVKNSSAKNHSDCSGVDVKETLLIPDLSKGNKLESSYKSENLYEIKGTLLSGKQFVAISQDGKLVGLYYLNAQ